jgi:hypothetical protein
MGEKINFNGKRERKRSLKWILREMGCEDADWIYLT